MEAKVTEGYSISATKYPKFSDAQEPDGFHWILESSTPEPFLKGKKFLAQVINNQIIESGLSGEDNLIPEPEEEEEIQHPQLSSTTSVQPIVPAATPSGQSPTNRQVPLFEFGDDTAIWSKPPSSPVRRPMVHPIQHDDKQFLSDAIEGNVANLLLAIAALEKIPECERQFASSRYSLDIPIPDEDNPLLWPLRELEKQYHSYMKESEANVLEMTALIPPGNLLECRRGRSKFEVLRN